MNWLETARRLAVFGLVDSEMIKMLKRKHIEHSHHEDRIFLFGDNDGGDAMGDLQGGAGLGRRFKVYSKVYSIGPLSIEVAPVLAGAGCEEQELRNGNRQTSGGFIQFEVSRETNETEKVGSAKSPAVSSVVDSVVSIIVDSVAVSFLLVIGTAVGVGYTIYRVVHSILVFLMSFFTKCQARISGFLSQIFSPIFSLFSSQWGLYGGGRAARVSAQAPGLRGVCVANDAPPTDSNADLKKKIKGSE